MTARKTTARKAQPAAQKVAAKAVAKTTTRKAGATKAAAKATPKRADHGRALGDAAAERDAAIERLIRAAGELTVKELAETLGITPRAVKHALWRRDVKRGGVIEHVGRGRYVVKAPKRRKVS